MEWSWKDAALGLVAAVMTILQLWTRRELKRLDEKAESSHVAALLAELKDHIRDDKEMRTQLTDRLDSVADIIGQTRESVAKISGKLGI